MTVIYAASHRFDPVFAENWQGFLEWSGLNHLREVISLDGMLCPPFFQELIAEDWNHNVHADFQTDFFVDLEYLVGRVGGDERANILAICKDPTPIELVTFTDPRFEFRGFDLMGVEWSGISALVNCGGFPQAFSATELSDFGLLTDYEMAVNVQQRLRAEYPDEHHAQCDVWAIWQFKR